MPSWSQIFRAFTRCAFSECPNAVTPGSDFCFSHYSAGEDNSFDGFPSSTTSPRLSTSQDRGDQVVIDGLRGNPKSYDAEPSRARVVGDADSRDRALHEGAKVNKKCAFCECNEVVDPEYDLCKRHNRTRKAGSIERCPGCSNFKRKRYKVCSFCNDAKTQVHLDKSQTANKTIRHYNSKREQARYRRESSPAWAAGDADARSFHVYILKLDGGEFYAGQTRELRERLSEHRDGRTQSTAGRNPKLVWFTEVSSRREATELEVELKKAIDGNPRIIRRMVTGFHDMVRELNFN